MANKIPYIHPFLFAVFPVLFLYSVNIDKIFFHETITSFLIVILVTVAALFITKKIIKNSFKTGLLVSVFLILFFSYGHVMEAIYISWLNSSFLPPPSHKYLLPFWILLFTGFAFYIIKSRRTFLNSNKIILLISIALNASILINIAYSEINEKELQTKNKIFNIESKTPDKPRDIYYIILDGYANAEILKKEFNFDNSEFLNRLTQKGFFIANKSCSNYASTFLSLASSLNMEYINTATEQAGKKSASWKISYEMVRNNELVRFLKSKGYKYYHLSSRHEASDYNENATENLSYSFMDNFAILLSQTTMIKAFVNIYEYDLRKSILFSFKKLQELNSIEGPKFIFAHIVSPHYPYLFDENGEPVIETKRNRSGNRWKQKENYINQLNFVNRKISEVVDKIISSSKIAPIIILQADHGSASTFNDLSLNQKQKLNKTMLEERFKIFNALNLPEISDSVLSDSISPVNTFRVVFNTYFNTNFKLHKDKCYFSTYDTPSDLTDVTEIIKRLEK